MHENLISEIKRPTKKSIMKNFLITMSGGTTQVINATLAGAIQRIKSQFPHSKIFAGYPGISGVLDDNLVSLDNLSEKDCIKILRTPASGLIGTTRVKPVDESDMDSFLPVLDKHDIGYFLNIGGNGTIKQSAKIAQMVGDRLKVAALPKTVDNDLGDEAFDKVLFTPGFPSCANYWRHKTHMMNLENLGSFSNDRILVAQTFGRKTGFLAGCARLADPHRKLPLIILLPEDQKPVDKLLGHINNTLEKHNRAIIVMCEGYDIDQFGEVLDPSGQIMYGSSTNTAAQLLVNACVHADMNARAFVPGFDQRSEMRFVSTIDLEAAFGVGQFAVDCLADDHHSFFASISRMEHALNGIGFTKVPFEQIKDYSRTMPERWIMRDQYDVMDGYVDYILPLIGVGQLPIPNEMQDDYFAYSKNIHGHDPSDIL